jgi:hypothetical protein
VVDNRPSPQGTQTSATSIRSPDFKDIYTNATRVSLSPWDMNITFTLTKEIMPGVLVGEDQAVVRMSPQQFKIFAESLLTTMTAWEEVFGAIIPTSPSLSKETMKAGILSMKEAIYKQTSQA